MKTKLIEAIDKTQFGRNAYSLIIDSVRSSQVGLYNEEEVSDTVWKLYEEARNKLIIAILALFERELPKEKDRTGNLDSPYLTGEFDGHNACLTKIKTKLKEE